MLLLSPQAYSSVGQVIPLCATNDCTQAIASFAPSTNPGPLTCRRISIDTSGRDQLIDLIAIVVSFRIASQSFTRSSETEALSSLPIRPARFFSAFLPTIITVSVSLRRPNQRLTLRNRTCARGQGITPSVTARANTANAILRTNRC